MCSDASPILTYGYFEVEPFPPSGHDDEWGEGVGEGPNPNHFPVVGSGRDIRSVVSE